MEVPDMCSPTTLTTTLKNEVEKSLALVSTSTQVISATSTVPSVSWARLILWRGLEASILWLTVIGHIKGTFNFVIIKHSNY